MLIKQEEVTYDARFHNPVRILFAGPSGSGKSSLIYNILRTPSIFKDPRCLQNVIYYHKENQESFSNFKNLVKEFIDELPTRNELKNKAEKYKDIGGSIFIIDDFGNEINEDICVAFTALSHHYNFSIFLTTQNLFWQSPYMRTTSLNSTHIVLFKNPRDGTQIRTLAQQTFPKRSSWMVEAFHEATQQPHSYFLLDMTQSCPEKIRYRSNILSNPISIYIPKEQ